MKLALIVNCKASRCSDKLIRRLRRSLGTHLALVEKTEYAGHATILARQLVGQGVDAIVVAGGDGTVNEAVNGILGSDAALGIIPCGTANDLANHLSIPGRAEDACAVVLRNHTRRIDLIRVNGWCIATTGGVGIACDVIRLVESIKYSRAGRRIAAALGGTLYLLALILAGIKYRGSSCRLCIENDFQDCQSSVFSLTLSNIPRLAGHFQLAPGAVDRDGRADLCCIQSTHGLLALLRSILGTLTGSHEQEANVTAVAGQRFEIRCERATAFFGDGIVKQLGDRLELEVLPAAVPVLIPDSQSEVGR